MPFASQNLAACAIGSDVFAFGGYRGGGGSFTSVIKFDTVANEWIILAAMPVACCLHSANVLNGLVYIVGAGRASRQVLCFDPVTDGWSEVASTSKKRQEGSTFVLGGCLYAAGGSGNGSSVERYNAATNTWTVMGNMLEAAGRLSFGAVTLGSPGRPEEKDLFDVLIAKASQ
jgi:hypothetical protein